MNVRTRIAPSPTGQDLHIGNAYTALINYVYAANHGGKFIIRIEDTDRTRFVDGSEDRILKSLDWLGIPHAEGPDIGGDFAPYRQSERLDQYKKYAQELAEKGHAFYCFCTPIRLAEMRKAQETNHEPPMYDGACKQVNLSQAKQRVTGGEKYVIRLNVPDSGTTTFSDVIRGEISFENKLIDDQVILKSDGFPTYHLGVVVDDHLMEISHVIRGEEWISSTPKHILLYEFLGWEKPRYAHLPLLRNTDKSKLSKRKNPVWVSWYREQGFLPEAILNYLALMGWSFSDDKEMFSIDEMIREFKLEDIKTTGPVFDIEKLKWMNSLYIRSKSDGDLMILIKKFFGTSLKRPEGDMVGILTLVKNRMHTLAEFWTLAEFFFKAPKEFEKPLVKDDIHLVRNALETSDWTHEAMEQAIRAACDKAGKKAKDIFMQLRLAITGKTVGPPLLESLEILGKEETLSRLKI